MDNNLSITIERLEKARELINDNFAPATRGEEETAEHIDTLIYLALITLRAQAEREKQPQPLTLDQLRERDGKPVFSPFYGWGLVWHTLYGSKPAVFIRFSNGLYTPATDAMELDSIYDRPPEAPHA